MESKEFLNWLADRLVNVYGESPNVDFVIKTRDIPNKYDSRIKYLETINKNQEETIKSLTKEIELWDRHSKKLQARINKYDAFLDMLCDKCEGSLLWYQYRWVVQTVAKFQSELRDD